MQNEMKEKIPSPFQSWCGSGWRTQYTFSAACSVVVCRKRQFGSF